MGTQFLETSKQMRSEVLVVCLLGSLPLCLAQPTSNLGLKDIVEGDYMQTSPPASNDWHYVTIRGQISSQNIFTWRNKAGVEWDLIFLEEESSGVYKFEVGENCPYYTDGYTEARLFTNTRNEIEGPGGMFTKQMTPDLGLKDIVEGDYMQTSHPAS